MACSFSNKTLIQLVISSILCLFSLNGISAVIVNTASGKVRGVDTEFGTKFLGIPYAAPPIKQLRWQPPQPVKAWSNIRSSNTFGASCPQFFTRLNIGMFNEDCLYLNVFIPNTDLAQKKPVIVWIHGGGLNHGTSSTSNPKSLVSEGIIVVTFNYRLGALGFMAHPELSKESKNGHSGNYGLMDQQALLQWVRTNIEKFGGDPDNITLLGQSAGGLSIQMHLIAPESQGLFHKAIIQSTGYSLKQPSLQKWERLGLKLAEQMGCPNQELSCLRQRSTRQIVRNQDRGEPDYLPIVDGTVITQSLKSALERKEFSAVPIIQGNTKEEFSIFAALEPTFNSPPISESNFFDMLATIDVLPEMDQQVEQEYNPKQFGSYLEAFSHIGTDYRFACPTQFATDFLSQATSVFKYEFADSNAPSKQFPDSGFTYGAYHGSDLIYLFPKRFMKLNEYQQRLSQNMIKYWTQFAKTGNPNIGDLPLWPQYHQNNPITLSLTTPAPISDYDFETRHRCRFWRQAY